jgi:hypothetical protein
MTPYPSQPLPSPANGRAGTVPGTPQQWHRSSEPRSGVSPVTHVPQRPVRPTPPAMPSQRYPLVSQLAPLGALKTAPGAARGHVKSTLTTWNMAAYIEMAELLISEMVTNSVEASTGEQGHPIYVMGRLPVIVVRLVGIPDGVVLEVWDSVPTLPEVKSPEGMAERGRGMFLVETLAFRWSWKTDPNWPGKCVWAELRAASLQIDG